MSALVDPERSAVNVLLPAEAGRNRAATVLHAVAMGQRHELVRGDDELVPADARAQLDWVVRQLA